MSLFSLKDVRNHPRRSAFDLSSKVAFSAKTGELLPIKWYFTMPGDKFTLKRQHFTRTQPVNTSAYTRIREYYDWFWVPFHLLWRNAPEVISQMQTNVQHANSLTSELALGHYLPTFANHQLKACLDRLKGKTNYFGFDRSDLSYKLLQYLRYGNCSGGNDIFGTSTKYSNSYSQDYRFDLNLSVFPLLAYKKFCQDYFRYSQWQDSSPYLWNIDYYTGAQQLLFTSLPSSGDPYWQSNTMFDLEYCNWNKDIFMGVLPDPQFGDVASIDTGGLKAQELDVQAKVSSSSKSSVYVGVRGTPSEPNFYINPGPDALQSHPLVVSLPSIAASFDVLTLRRGED